MTLKTRLMLLRNSSIKLNDTFYVIIALVLVLGFTAFTGAPYVPSKKRELRQVFKQLYALSSKDTLVDLGSGDGVVLREARRCGAAAVGYEIGPVYVAVSRLLARGDKKQQIIAKVTGKVCSQRLRRSYIHLVRRAILAVCIR